MENISIDKNQDDSKQEHMKIFITGASGFIGKNLVIELTKRQHHLICLIRPETSAEDYAFLKKHDVTLTTSPVKGIHDADIVYHIAGKLGDFNSPWEKYRESNLELTQTIVSECNRQKLIYLSTAGIHGACEGASETSPARPLGFYEISKYKAEDIVRKYQNHVIVRPGLVYGPYNQNLLPLFKLIKKRFFPIIGAGTNNIQPLFVADLIQFLLQISNDPIANSTFLIAGEPIAVADFCREIATQRGYSAREIHIPTSLAYGAAWANEIIAKRFRLKPIITFNRIKILTQTRTFDLSKIKKKFKYNPTPLASGLAQTLEYYIKNGNLAC